MKILALDLGTLTGVADNLDDGLTVTANTWVLATKKEMAPWSRFRLNRRFDPRVERFARHVACWMKRGPDIVIFEDVQFHTSLYQTQLWASLRGALWGVMGLFPRALVECVPVGTLKKFATGCNSATKEMMAKSLFKLHPEWKSANIDDNAIDALWLFYWAELHLKNATV